MVAPLMVAAGGVTLHAVVNSPAASTMTDKVRRRFTAAMLPARGQRRNIGRGTTGTVAPHRGGRRGEQLTPGGGQPPGRSRCRRPAVTTEPAGDGSRPGTSPPAPAVSAAPRPTPEGSMGTT